jgi:hypothetical protein
VKKVKHDISKIKQALFWKEIGECVPVIGGGVTLISLGQVRGGIACVAVCAIMVLTEALVMPFIEKRYLTEA